MTTNGCVISATAATEPPPPEEETTIQANEVVTQSSAQLRINQRHPRKC